MFSAAYRRIGAAADALEERRRDVPFPLARARCPRAQAVHGRLRAADPAGRPAFVELDVLCGNAEIWLLLDDYGERHPVEFGLR
ncbi:MAG TPA: hypothetical protein VK081_05855 [Planctomycetota bacterium]|nr:hypothetical protein [Planctomycetota bacterium]